MDGESLEYSTLINCTPKLVIAFKGDTELRHWLRRNGFLPQDVYERVTAVRSMLSEADKALEVVKAIQDKVDLNKDNYHTLVGHLKKLRGYQDITEILEKEHRRLKGMATQSQETESKESICMRHSQRLLELHDRLVDTLQFSVGSIATKTYSKKLISEDTYSAMLEPGIGKADKTRMVLLNVKSTASREPDALDKFCDILKDSGTYDNLVKELKK